MEYRKLRLGKVGSDPVVDFAVRELARYLRLMDPQLVIDVLYTEDVRCEWKNIVWVGVHPSLEAFVPAVKDKALDDAIAIQIEEGRGYITGSNARSVLLAVYRLLREFGCDWVYPGIEGERIPRKKLDMIRVSVHETAANRHRGICLEGSNIYDTVEDVIDYIPKALMNSYFIQFDVPIHFFKWSKWRDCPGQYSDNGDISVDVVRAMTASLEDEIARRGLLYHKVGHGWTCNSYGVDCYEWYPKEVYAIPEEMRPHLAQINGQRDWFRNDPLNTNLCYSNPDARNKITDAVVRYAKENPNIDYLHVWLADGQRNHCECAACQTWRPADWYMVLLNELDEKLTAEGLDTKIGIAGTYLDLLWEPLEVQLKNPSRVALMFCPASRSDYGANYKPEDIRTVELPPYVRNQSISNVSLARSFAHLLQWQKSFRGDLFGFCYHMCDRHVMDPGHERCARDLFDFVKSLKEFRVDGLVIPQQQRCFFPTALPTYAMAEALWNADCDFDAVANKYYRSAFGEKTELVRSYFACVSDLFLIYSDSGNALVHCTDYRLLYSKLEEIRQAAQNFPAEEPYAYSFEALLLHTHYLELIGKMLEAIEQGLFDQADGIHTELVDWIVTNEVALRKVLDGPHVHAVWTRIWRWAGNEKRRSIAASEAEQQQES